MRKFLALLLTVAMVLGLVPSVFATPAEAEAKVLTQEDYYTADLMWEAVNAKKAEMKERKATPRQTTEALIQQVTTSPYYEEDSLIRNGDHFFWKTVDGVPCGYSPRLAEKAENATPLAGYDPATAETVITTSYATKSNSPNSREVYLIQPYYGIDEAFTTQYETEAQSLANYLKGTSTIYRTTAATVDAIADAIESGAVVIFDSHGDTDYASGDDSVSRANSSYICLQTNAGLTSADYEEATGPFGTYYHAYYGGSNGTMKYYCVDGTVIANHMEKESPNGMLWAAICYGMATDGLHAPLRAKGVEVAYGYSQSVTFTYDYMWEEAFWNNMVLGGTVAESVALMKEEVGLWDWAHSENYDTIAEARATYCAFPIVVSSQDAYPGHGKVDDLQSVNSTWLLLPECPHPGGTYVPGVPATCENSGTIPYYQCTDCTAIFSDEKLTQRISSDDTILPATGHSYDDGSVSVAVGCTTNGELLFTCKNCGHTYTETINRLGHDYINGICNNCGLSKPLFVPFAIGESGTFVIAAKVNNIYYGFPNNFTHMSGKHPPVTVEGKHGYVDESEAGAVALTLTYHPENGKYTISNGAYYLRYPSSTNLGGTSDPYYWAVEKGVNGSWRFVSETASRIIAYRTSGYNYFGCYYGPNVISGGKEYFDVEILPVATPTQEEIPVDPPTTPEVLVDEAVTIGHTLNLASDISINYAVKTSLLEDYDSYYMICEIPVYEGTEVVSTEEITIQPVIKGEYYYFTLTGITAVHMGNLINATVYMTKGEETYCSPTDVYSVATYAYTQMGKANYPVSLKKLCAELLRYGAAAQTFKGYRTDALVDNQMTDEQRAYLTDLESVTFNQVNSTLGDVENPTVTWVSKTLNLESKVGVKFIVNLTNFVGDPSTLEFRYSYDDYMGVTQTGVISGATLYYEERNFYSFEIDCLLAAELRSMITGAVYCDGVQVSESTVFTPDSYANNRTGDLLTLCKALMSYSDTALVFFTLS